MRVVVAGDVVVDHHVYEGERSNPAATRSRGVHVVREFGGAKALADLIQAVCVTTKTRLDAKREEAKTKYERELRDYEVAGDPEKKRPEEPVVIPVDPLESSQALFGLKLPGPNAQPCGHHGLAIFKPYPKGPQEPKTLVWRASTLLGYGYDNPEPAQGESKHSEGHCDRYKPKRDLDNDADVLVLDDAAFLFRKSKECWMLDVAEKAKWIILKISAPICRGDLWEELKRFRSKLIVVVSVTELRPEESGISAGLSWERTIGELATALANDLTLQELMSCRHLVINFSADGGLWLDNRPGADHPETRLVHDASSIEGQWAERTEGTVFGFLSCMVAAVTKGVIVALATDSANSTNAPTTPDMVTAISSGLSAMRDLRTHGHGVVGKNPPTGYPIQRLAEVLHNPQDRFSRCLVPWMDLSTEKLDPMSWSIAVQSQISGTGTPLPPMPMSGLAQQVVLRGRRVLNHLPNATFGDLFTVDRMEIEALRTLRQLMQRYKRSHGGGKPLSIGVFGPPGAGKSFGVKQIGKEIFGKQAWLEFNLSQFNQSDLIGALHQVRDKVLEIGIPVVFWDEFDSKNYDWLQYLLAPMQDGRFQDAQINHPIGSCVFIFAGATSHTFQQFGPSLKSKPDELKDFKLKKGPDFISRLDGYFNVLGPNPRQRTDGTGDPDDTSAPIRRALLLRSFLCGKSDNQLKIDPGLLRALLEVPKYTNGARSLQKFAQSLKPKKPIGPVRRSDLCSPTQLAMFVDFPTDIAPLDGGNRSEQVYRQFMELCRAHQEVLDDEEIETLAESIHLKYQECVNHNNYPLRPPNELPYKQLPREFKDTNRAAARRIPFVLAIAGLELREKSKCQNFPANYDDQVQEHIEHHLEIMSELEHDLWTEERFDAGWRYGQARDDERRIHDLMRPYEQLSDSQKDKDRGSVRDYIKHANSVGSRIVFAGTKI